MIEAIATIDYYTLVGAGMATVFFGLLAASYLRKKPLSAWHWLTIGTVSGFIASMVQSYTQLFDWVALGLTGVSTAATLFVAGMAGMIGVMAYNLLATRGKTAVR
ncbi:MAG: hypothetical protein RBT25_10985 [Lentisphaeria bacterium]|nr:hypothetical protein [Lentisphaeria bacterium]